MSARVETVDPEQHGPTGLIGTDALCAEAVARGVRARTGALLGRTLP